MDLVSQHCSYNYVWFLHDFIDYRTQGDDTKGTQIELVEPNLMVTIVIVKILCFLSIFSSRSLE